MSPKAKLIRTVEPESPKPDSGPPSPFDAEEFLEANRRNRDKLRAAAQAKRAKEAARARRRATPWWKRSAADTSEVADSAGGAADHEQAGAGALETSGGRARWAAGVLSLLLVLSLVTAGVFAYLYREADQRADDADAINQLRPGAVEVAGNYAATLMTYDSADFAELDSRITDISTPAFAKDFIEGSRQAREGSVGAQAVATATVRAAGIESISSTEAVVLVALDQTVTSPQTNADLPEGIPYQSRVEVTLEWTGDGWKLSGLSVI
jgi:Mce-associated membrane protein